MRARRFQIVALLIVTLIFGAAQCIKTCTAQSCSSPEPPCHRHSAPDHDTSASCVPDSLVPDTHGLSFAHVMTVGLVVPTVQSAPLFVVVDALAAPAFSPPSPPVYSSTILRI